MKGFLTYIDRLNYNLLVYSIIKSLKLQLITRRLPGNVLGQIQSHGSSVYSNNNKKATFAIFSNVIVNISHSKSFFSNDHRLIPSPISLSFGQADKLGEVNIV